MHGCTFSFKERGLRRDPDLGTALYFIDGAHSMIGSLLIVYAESVGHWYRGPGDWVRMRLVGPHKWRIVV